MYKEEGKDYNELLTLLLDYINSPDETDYDEINKILSELCKVLRISKGVAEFYNSMDHENADKGKVFVCYNQSGSSHEIISKRIVTKSMTVVKCKVYMLDGQEDLSDEEFEKVERIVNIVLKFIAYNGLQDIVDDLTFYDNAGYRNYRSFVRYVNRLIDDNFQKDYTAIHYNLRHFTLINQEIGRSAGDVAMRNYYDLFESIIGENGIVCRLGGDNFIAIFEDKCFDEILTAIKGTPIVYNANEGGRIMVSASAGVFRIPKGSEIESVRDILNKISLSSQVAKNGGKDSIVFFDDKMLIDKEKIMRIQQLLPFAISNEEFKVFYQPKIDIQTGNIVGAEALCRWLHDDKLIPPIDFIPVLEQTTDICKLDFYMLDHVCKDIRRWILEGREVVRVSVNLSRKHMMDVDLLKHIIQIIDDNEIPHKYIEIELTETTTDVEFRDLKRVVNGLQKAGICTSVDDFGMGYSSLNLIKEINWNVIKVDKSFLPMDEDDDKSTRSIMFKYVVAMAKELGLECIAEGVETKNQVEILKNNQCTYAQGFYFDKPLPIDDFEERLDRHKYEM